MEFWLIFGPDEWEIVSSMSVRAQYYAAAIRAAKNLREVQVINARTKLVRR